MKSFLSILCCAFLFASCSKTAIANLDAFQERNITTADVLPSKEDLNGGKSKVVVFDLKNSDEISKRVNTGQIITSKLIQVVSKSNADVIDRNSASQFADEIRLSQESDVDYDGPEVADYAIDGRVLQTTFHVTYNPPERYKDSTGKIRTTRPSCTYVGQVSGDYKLYQLPSNQILKTFSFRDSERRTVSTTRSGDPVAKIFLSGLINVRLPPECRPNQGLTDALINDAAGESIRKSRLEIQNFFSPKGYITNMYNHEDVYLAKVNVGSNNGLVHDQPVQIFTIRFTNNALTGEQNQEERVVARGFVTNQIQPDSAYILIEENQDKIRLGDFVKVEFIKSGFESFSDLDWIK